MSFRFIWKVTGKRKPNKYHKCEITSLCGIIFTITFTVIYVRYLNSAHSNNDKIKHHFQMISFEIKQRTIFSRQSKKPLLCSSESITIL